MEIETEETTERPARMIGKLEDDQPGPWLEDSGHLRQPLANVG